MVDDSDKIIVIEEEQQESKEEAVESVESAKKVETPPNILKSNKKKFLGGVVILILFLFIITLILRGFVLKKSSKKKIEPIAQKVIKPKEALDVHFIKGLNLENEGNLQEAIEEFKKSGSQIFLAYINIAKIYQAQNKLDKADEYTKKAFDYLDSTLNPAYMDAYLYLFSYFINHNNLSSAKELLSKLSSKGVDNHEYQIMQVYYSFLTQPSQSILPEIQRLINSGYKDNLLYEMAGYIYATKKDYKKAQEYFSSVGETPDVCYNLSFIEFYLNHYNQALDCAVKSYDANQNALSGYFAYLLALHQNRIQDANILISNLSNIGINTLNYFSIKPTINFEEAKKQIDVSSYGIDQGLQSLIIIRDISPIIFTPNTTNTFNLGDVYLSYGLLEKAKESYLNAINLTKSLEDANKAMSLYNQKNLTGALTYYQLAYTKNPQNPILFYNVALLNEKNYNFEKAKTMFLIMLNRYPAFPLSYFNLALIYFVKGSKVKAYEYLNKFKSQMAKISQKNHLNNYETFTSLLENKQVNQSGIDLRDFLILKAIGNGEYDYLKLEKNYLNDKFGIDFKNTDKETIVSFLSKFNPNLNRLSADLYLEKGMPKEALQSYTKLDSYTGSDYYKMGLCYLLLGYDTQADNYFTKAILLSKKNIGLQNQVNFSKLLIQIRNRNIRGMQDLTKKINSNQGMLSFDIEVNK